MQRDSFYAYNITGIIFKQEAVSSRIDNVIFRGCFAVSRAGARQIVAHGHILVNGRRVDVPSYLVKQKDEIEVIKKEKVVKKIKNIYEEIKDRGVPSWLGVDAKDFKIQILRLPQRQDVQIPIQEQLIIELYSK